MKICLSWLASYVVEKPDWKTVLDKLTMAGIELEDISTYNEDDQVVVLKITPNRGDCLSVVGLVREIAALTGCKAKPMIFGDVIAAIPDVVSIKVINTEVCPSYHAMVVKGIDNKKKLPEHILSRLEACGMKSVSPIVDLTNYVMLELGQPLHAFDYAKSGSNITVRMAKADETIKLLDETTAKLHSDTLVICGRDDTPIAIAGVMGGANAEVTENTDAVIIESAFFTPAAISGKAKLYGVNSDAAYRYERGVDSHGALRALNHVVDLICKYLGGVAGPLAQESHSSEARILSISYTQINQFIGQAIEYTGIDQILTSLGFGVLAKDNDTLVIEVPSFRHDIAIPEDIIEEVVRVYGYDNIVPVMPMIQCAFPVPATNIPAIITRLKEKMVGLGFNEIIGYAFLEPDVCKLFNASEVLPVTLRNPIAGLSTMRPNLFADLIKTLQYNLNRGYKSARLFEIARVFHGEDEFSQPVKIAGLIYGDYAYHNWAMGKQEVDYFDLKRVVLQLLVGVGKINFSQVENNPIFHPGVCAKISSANMNIGMIGKLHPSIGQKLGLPVLPYMFELDVSSIEASAVKFKVSKLSKYPKVERDISFTVPHDLESGCIVDLIMRSELAYLKNVEVFDVYQGKNMATGTKRIALGVRFQADRTLTDQDINSSIAQIIAVVSQNFNAVHRIEV